MTALSPDPIVAGLLRGDPECERLVRSWINATVSYLTRGSSIDRDDLASESFVALFDALRRGHYHGPALRTYIQSICTHKFFDRLRQLKQMPMTGSESLDDMPTDSLSAEDRALAILRIERLRESLARMSEKDRLAVILWSRDTDYREIAARLGSTYGAVRKRVCQALKQLTTMTGKGRKP
jgi:RNA polymerase sigma-70 factor (ECF subfamily)